MTYLSLPHGGSCNFFHSIFSNLTSLLLSNILVNPHILIKHHIVKMRQNAHFETTTTCKTSKIVVEAKKKHVLRHEHREIQRTRLERNIMYSGLHCKQ